MVENRKCFIFISKNMKSKDIQRVVKTKYENGDGPAKMYRDLAGAVSLPTIKLWIKMMNTTGSITLLSPPGCPRTVRTKAAIVKINNRLNQKKRMSTRKFAKEMNTSKQSKQRIFREDLACKSYKKTIQPKLTNLQKENKRVKFANWALNNCSKEDTKNGFSQIKIILILTAYTIHKKTECGLPVEKKLAEKVVFSRKLNILEK